MDQYFSRQSFIKEISEQIKNLNTSRRDYMTELVVSGFKDTQTPLTEPPVKAVETQAGALMREKGTQMRIRTYKDSGSSGNNITSVMETQTQTQNDYFSRPKMKSNETQAGGKMKEKATQMKRQKFKSMEAQTSGEFFGESSITNAIQNITDSTDRELERLKNTIDSQVETIAERDFEIKFSSLDMKKQKEVAISVFQSTGEDALIDKLREIKLSGLTSAEKLETTKNLISYMKDALDMRYGDVPFTTFITGMDALMNNPRMKPEDFRKDFDNLIISQAGPSGGNSAEMSAVEVNESDINTLTNNEEE